MVVVIGYGSSKRKDLTGSLSTVDAKDIEDVPFNTVDNALAGKAAGVQVTKADGTAWQELVRIQDTRLKLVFRR